MECAPQTSRLYPPMSLTQSQQSLMATPPNPIPYDENMFQHCSSPMSLLSDRTSHSVDDPTMESNLDMTLVQLVVWWAPMLPCLVLGCHGQHQVGCPFTQPTQNTPPILH